ncbi:MAG: CoB--CoM heterodisulfide reductase iron-sulfur subunit A family protein [Desulfarculus sp.]|nr:CoB--CoM heterodisulfide reductase iron-sulfur subunit A family protein [Pseudomonadota bacterium]MBV1716320.1 CoB--CoM heterodisulfide reductase iron-sulfur subunit A family protein [Desulfarculus sp.]MBU4574977.1 CoB--CoM heterodisulfide reductase iron-sulfur subunit A family protein [Pseudomonadota bacterium]MBU4599334.1 CoB--CoM heterodisulfide reductase iron-sulfur subunit A family protein [Pseudomonadota bacterium]MBV1739357.1 CoB--CoM heterodisulfide reductase iron-sulfur subunit A fa
MGQSILVVGGGMSGVSAALEAAEAGYDVVLVEKNPYLGGRVAQLHQYFPKLCPPYCGLEINFKRIKSNPRIKLYTMSEVTGIEGEPGNYKVTINQLPRYVNERCTACGKCADAVEATIPSSFDYGLGQIKAAYLPHELAYPYRYVIDPSIVETEDGAKAKEACPYDAVVLDDAPKETIEEAGAIVWAAGWSPYDASKVEYYNFNSSPDIITNVQMERLAAAGGPTGGKIVKLSNGEAPKKVAFIQCAGSRDVNHLPFCSTICCLASLKQATYVREQLKDAEVTIYFIDIRAMDRNEDFYTKVKADEKISFVKSKIGLIEPGENGVLVLNGENTTTGERFKAEHDLVVLATGMQPNTDLSKIPADMVYDEYGFVQNAEGIFGAGTVRRPGEVHVSVQDGTSAALKAIQVVAGR